MDVDPLADTIPPRHTIESDEEEDEYSPVDTKATVETINVKIIGDLPQLQSLVIATGDVANFWAKGTDLGEQSGAILVNEIQVGLAFRPAWTKAVVIISEVFTKLPLWAMYHYALTIVDTLKPARVALLDTYPVATYITVAPMLFQDAPIRFLSTSSLNFPLQSKPLSFTPPNLLQSTSAAFLSILSTSFASPGTVILMPSPYAPHPQPKVLSLSNFSHLSEDRIEWSQDAMSAAQELLFAVIGGPTLPKWENLNEKGIPTARQKSSIGEGSMYI